jgi:hypothetical protein
MDPNAIAGMIFTLVLALMVGGFVLLFPLSRQLGRYLESKLDKNPKLTSGLTPADVESLRATLKALQSDVERVADRQDFMEQLLSKKKDAAALRAADNSVEL